MTLVKKRRVALPSTSGGDGIRTRSRQYPKYREDAPGNQSSDAENDGKQQQSCSAIARENWIPVPNKRDKPTVSNHMAGPLRNQNPEALKPECLLVDVDSETIPADSRTEFPEISSIAHHSQSDKCSAVEFEDRAATEFHSISESLCHYLLDFRKIPTGTWLLESTIFKHWRQTEIYSFIWLRGAVGQGKSTITSAVIASLRANIRFGDIVSGAFCDFKYRARCAAIDILRAILLDLLAGHEIGETRDRLQDLLADLQQLGGNISVKQMEHFFSAIRCCIRSHETLWLVLDGLDDLDGIDSEAILPGSRAALNALIILASKFDKRHKVKIFLSSRPGFCTQGSTPKSCEIDMDSSSPAKKDASKFIRQGIRHLQILPNIKDFARLDAEAIISYNNGSFLWSKLVLRAMSLHCCSSNNLAGLLLSAQSRNIPDLYQFMFDQIALQDRLQGVTALQWVSSTARPLHLIELSRFLALDADLSEYDVERISGGLLVVTKDQTVILIHVSVKSFIHSLGTFSKEYIGHPDEMIAQTCLQSMSLDGLLDTLLSFPRFGSYSNLKDPLASSYALENWKFHYALTESRSSFLAGLLHSRLKEALERRNPPSYRNNFSSHRFVVNTGLRLSSIFGFEKLAKLSLDMGADAHICSDANTVSALHLATRFSHEGVVKLLLQYGAIPFPLANQGLTPIYFAVASGNSEVVKLLNSCCQGFLAAKKESTDGPSPALLSFEASPIPAFGNANEWMMNYTLSVVGPPSFVEESLPPIQFLSFKHPFATTLLTDKELLKTPQRSEGNSIVMKWFPGVHLYEALQVASKNGIGVVIDLLLAAGNDPTSLEELLQIMATKTSTRSLSKEEGLDCRTQWSPTL